MGVKDDIMPLVLFKLFTVSTVLSQFHQPLAPAPQTEPEPYGAIVNIDKKHSYED